MQGVLAPLSTGPEASIYSHNWTLVKIDSGRLRKLAGHYLTGTPRNGDELSAVRSREPTVRTEIMDLVRRLPTHCSDDVKYKHIGCEHADL